MSLGAARRLLVKAHQRVNGVHRLSGTSVSAPELRPFFGFYGGKLRDALKHHPAPQHDTIIEPFARRA